MNFKTGILYSVATVVTFSLTACGGGGGSSSNSASVSFPSSATLAEPTIENGVKVKEVVTADQQSYIMNSVNGSGSTNTALIVKKVNDIMTDTVSFNDNTLNETLDETIDCPGGGTMYSNGSGGETTGGTVTTTFNNCNIYGTTMNGKLLTEVKGYHATYEEFSYIKVTYLTDVTISEDGLTATVLGGSYATMEISSFNTYGEAKNMKMSISAITQVGNLKAGQENAIYHFYIPDYSMAEMYQTAGKIYIGNLAAYVQYDTSYDMSQTPFVLDYDGLKSGEARYTMSNGAKVKILAESYTTKVYIDSDGDGVYELSE